MNLTLQYFNLANKLNASSWCKNLVIAMLHLKDFVKPEYQHEFFKNPKILEIDLTWHERMLLSVYTIEWITPIDNKQVTRYYGALEIIGMFQSLNRDSKDLIYAEYSDMVKELTY